MWSDWLVFCDCDFSLSALWCPLSVPTVLLGFLLPWTRGISSHCSSRTHPLLLTLDVGYLSPLHCLLLQCHTVEMRNRFKGLDLIDREPDELWTEVCDIVQETGKKTIPKKKKHQKAKWLPEEALQIAVKRSKKQRRKGKIYPFECTKTS